ncbi:MAG: Fic family protein [archaeon]
MVSGNDVFLAIGLHPNTDIKVLLEKMGKKIVSYNAIYKHLKQLEKTILITELNGKYMLIENDKAKKLFLLLEYCFKNNIDYNVVVSEKTAEIVNEGLRKTTVKGTNFNSKTFKKIITVLEKHGVLVVESKKPIIARIVYSRFLEELVKYFYGKVKVKEKSFPATINEKKLDSKLMKKFSEYRKLGKTLFEKEEIEFIHSSLSLEGNTLTLPETEKLIAKNVVPENKPFHESQEVMDYKKALDEFLFTEKELSLEIILGFHKTAMNWMKKGAGEIRKQNVKIKGNPNFKTPDHRRVPELIKNFFEKARTTKANNTVELVEKASFLHNKFQRIHPFIDGNSRTSRAIFNKVLIEKDFPVIRIPVGFNDQYLSLTKLSEKRDDKKFCLLMKQIVLENMKLDVKRLSYA